MHTIRLRSAWRSSGETHTRRFNRPTGLDPDKTVWIAVDDASAVESATLNGKPIALGGLETRCDVTLLLKPSNVLVLAIAAEVAPRLLTTVQIEIETSGEPEA